jgi:hypothetical protein
MNNDQRDTIKLEADGQTTIIQNITIRDEDVHTLLQATDEKERTNTIIDAIKIGICGLKQMRTGAELNYVENGFNEMINKFNYALDPSFNGSFFYKFVNLIKDYYDRGGRVECILDPGTQGGPINKLQSELRGEIQKLRDIIIKKEAETEIIDKTPMKGYDFEDTCENILSELTSTKIGDNLERTTKTCGLMTGSFAGDFVLTLQGMSDKKIIFETKDVECISEPMIIKSLETAMRNRGGKFGIFVVKYRQGLPKKLGWFHELNSTMLICAVSDKTTDILFPQLLHFAVEWAKLRLQKEMDIQKETMMAITEGITQIGKKLDRCNLIQTQCSNAEKAIAEIRELSATLKNDIAEHITKMKQVISLSINNSTGDEK